MWTLYCLNIKKHNGSLCLGNGGLLLSGDRFWVILKLSVNGSHHLIPFHAYVLFLFEKPPYFHSLLVLP